MSSELPSQLPSASVSLASGASLSPCIGLCRLDDDICRGCFRHVDEIAGWGLLDVEAQRKILARLPARRLSLSSPDPVHD